MKFLELNLFTWYAKRKSNWSFHDSHDGGNIVGHFSFSCFALLRRQIQTAFCCIENEVNRPDLFHFPYDSPISSVEGGWKRGESSQRKDSFCASGWRQSFTLFATTNQENYESVCYVLMNEFFLLQNMRRQLLIFLQIFTSFAPKLKKMKNDRSEKL